VGAVLSYFQALTDSMTMLAKNPGTVFVGQGVKYDGQRMHASFSGVPMEQRIEFPVAEDFQMGFCMGLALQGYIPVCIYPRMDFLLLACNQLVNHLDKVREFKPKVLIRVAVGSATPLDPGPQHTQDHSRAFRSMLTTIPVMEILNPNAAVETYRTALNYEGSVMVVEFMHKYQQ
jgi:pyruvate/2-oxoglutarate/acetoin dehydrogenase E1 component